MRAHLSAESQRGITLQECQHAFRLSPAAIYLRGLDQGCLDAITALIRRSRNLQNNSKLAMIRKRDLATRRHFIGGIVAYVDQVPALAQATPEAPKQADFLFARAKGMTYDKATNRLP